VTKPALNTHNVRIESGKHAGELYTRLPVSYLRWMVSVHHGSAALAQAELDRRGTQNPTMDISGHAMDRLSVHALHVYQADCTHGEGIHSWLLRVATEAFHGNPIEPGRYAWGPLILCIDETTAWPVVKTVLYRPRANGKRNGKHPPADHPEDHPMEEQAPAPAVNLTPVESSYFKQYGYDHATQTLAIEFQDKPGGEPGGLFHYAEFPAEKWAEFEAAPSKGAWFHRHVRSHPGGYAHTRIR